MLVVFGGRIVKGFGRGEATEEQVMSYALGFGTDGTAEPAGEGARA
jgi:hypothetical protein